VLVEPIDKLLLQTRRPSVSASACARRSTGKTPLQRMEAALALGRRDRLIRKLAGRGRREAARTG
jgi:hypothetical protein